MSWIQFLTWMLSIYSFYYLSLFSFEYFRGRQIGTEDNQLKTINFSQDIVAEIVSGVEPAMDEDEIDFFLGGEEDEDSPASYAIGGVSIKELFSLARSESIEYTKQVSF